MASIDRYRELVESVQRGERPLDFETAKQIVTVEGSAHKLVNRSVVDELSRLVKQAPTKTARGASVIDAYVGQMEACLFIKRAQINAAARPVGIVLPMVPPRVVFPPPIPATWALRKSDVISMNLEKALATAHTKWTSVGLDRDHVDAGIFGRRKLFVSPLIRAARNFGESEVFTSGNGSRIEVIGYEFYQQFRKVQSAELIGPEDDPFKAFRDWVEARFEPLKKNPWPDAFLAKT